jgi:hypothetical protein
MADMAIHPSQCITRTKKGGWHEHLGKTDGAPLDREIGDMIPRDGDGRPIRVSEDLGRQFLYARYNADLSAQGLAALGLPGINPAHVQKLDSIEYIDDLRRVGQKVAAEIEIEHFGDFIRMQE